jgi:hypothetical protein
MRLSITCRSDLSFDLEAVPCLQRIRMVPASSPLQSVHSWSVSMEGAREEARFVDHLGNETRLVSIATDQPASVEAGGEVETFYKAGVLGRHLGFAPLWLFLKETSLTPANKLARSLAASVADGEPLESLHRLMAAIVDLESCDEGDEETGEGAEPSALDRAHVFIAAARVNRFPARLVSGYVAGESTEVAAIHQWAEAHVDGLGWVGFDTRAGVSPDERYVRIAVGRDFSEARPVSGLQVARSTDHVAMRITVGQ